MDGKASVLFKLIDERIDEATKAVCSSVYSQRSDMVWTLEQRQKLTASIRAELRSAVQGILGTFDNVGGVLPDDISGWKICGAEDRQDIRAGAADYADMWLDFLQGKEGLV